MPRQSEAHRAKVGGADDTGGRLVDTPNFTPADDKIQDLLRQADALMQSDLAAAAAQATDAQLRFLAHLISKFGFSMFSQAKRRAAIPGGINFLMLSQAQADRLIIEMQVEQ